MPLYVCVRIFYIFDQMIKLLRHLHRIYALFVILFFFFLFYPFYYFFARSASTYGILNKCRQLNSRLVCIFTPVLFRYTFETPLNKDQTYIYCANHCSNLDIMIMCLLGKGRFHFMGKEELLKNPVLKIFFQTIDIPVNRESKMSAFRAFKRAGDNLEAGMSLIIFPEGRIDSGNYPPTLLPFKNGPFRLAIDKNVPIVPVSITNAWKYMWDDGGKYGSRPGVCDIYVHKPIFTADMDAEGADVLKDEVFRLIASKMITK